MEEVPMKKPFIALLLLLGVAAMAANLAFAGPEDQPELGNKLVNARLVKEMLSARAHTTRVNAGVDPDSVYVGHSWTDHTGYDGVNASSITNYWNIYTGVYFPTTSNANNALWDFDNTTGFDRYVGDSLAGWWPMRRTYSSTGSLTLTDDNRPWWALDHGNQVNYVKDI